MAAYKGKDVAKLKNKGGKWKYMSEADMLSIAEPFAPYRYVQPIAFHSTNMRFFSAQYCRFGNV